MAVPLDFGPASSAGAVRQNAESRTPFLSALDATAGLAFTSPEEPLNAGLTALGIDDLGAANRGDSRVLQPQEANDRFGIGPIKFDTPIPEDAARLIQARQRKQMEREERLASAATFAEAPIGRSARFLLGDLGANLLTPGNLAIGAVTFGAGEGIAALRGGAAAVRSAEAAAAASRSTAATIGIRAAEGAAIGGAQVAAVQPLVFESTERWHVDYTMADALQNTLIGAGLGGALGALGGAFEARRMRRPDSPPGEAAPADGLPPSPQPAPAVPGTALVRGIDFEIIPPRQRQDVGFARADTNPPQIEGTRQIEGPKPAAEIAPKAAEQPVHVDPQADADAAETALSQVLDGKPVDVSPILDRRLFVPGPDGAVDLGYIIAPDMRGPIRLGQDIAERFPLTADQVAAIGHDFDRIVPGSDGSMLLVRSSDGVYLEVARRGDAHFDALSTGKLAAGAPDRPLVGGNVLEEMQAKRQAALQEMVKRQSDPTSDMLYEQPRPAEKPDAEAALRGETTPEAADALLKDAEADLEGMVRDGLISEDELAALRSDRSGIEATDADVDAFEAGAGCFTRRS